MIQIAKERMKEISDKQMQAIKKIVQSRDFTLSEYRKLKEVLDRRVITRHDASVFLEYCFAKVRFERYFNGHHHKAYAACCFCKGRDGLIRIESVQTGGKDMVLSKLPRPCERQGDYGSAKSAEQDWRA